MLKKLTNNKSGFTLTEVLIAVMVLTVAIVTSSNLLVSLIRSNDTNEKSIQAYYLAIEGIEAVRQIRDTNWLHNRDWLKADSDNNNLWGEQFDVGGEYSIDLELGAFFIPPDKRNDVVVNKSAVNNARTWSVSSAGGTADVADVQWVTGEESVFDRVITISEYKDKDDNPLDNYILVESRVSWETQGRHREVFLTEVLTNWKNGAL
jgi:prepilin-type N-terminal cleavage/methylation domain-containing protein